MCAELEMMECLLRSLLISLRDLERLNGVTSRCLCGLFSLRKTCSQAYIALDTTNLDFIISKRYQCWAKRIWRRLPSHSHTGLHVEAVFIATPSGCYWKLSFFVHITKWMCGPQLSNSGTSHLSAFTFYCCQDSPIEASTPHIPATIHSATKKKGRTPAGTSSNVRKTARSKVRSASLSRGEWPWIREKRVQTFDLLWVLAHLMFSSWSV